MHESNAAGEPVIPPTSSTPAPEGGDIAEVLAVEPAPMQPVQLGERVEIIDILRGFALLGILCVNMQFYTTPFAGMSAPEPYWPETHDRIARGFIKTFCEGKFYILFSFLFGLGICIQMFRADARGKPFAWHQVKRMLVLLGIGLVHAFGLWMGDVLITYALLGFPLLLFIRLSPKTILILALISYLIPLVVVGVFAAGFEVLNHYGPEAAAQDPDSFLGKLYTTISRGLAGAAAGQAEAAAEAKRIYSSGTYGELFGQRAAELLMMYTWVPLAFWPTVMGMFLLGLWAGKNEVFSRLEEYLPFFWRWRWPALALGLAGNLTYGIIADAAPSGMPDRWMFLAIFGLTVGAPALTFFYVSTLVLFSRSEVGQRWLRPLAYVGRMALTNYLLQSVICTTIFYSYGGGLYASIGPLAGLVLTVVIYVPQIPFSMLWLSRFRFGPMEWLWRTLTYGKPQPMRL